jgi:hypothetical protein
MALIKSMALAMKYADWRLEVGGWKLEAGGWKLEAGNQVTSSS